MKPSSTKEVHKLSTDLADSESGSVIGAERGILGGRSHGYTLIEVLIVVTVVGMLAVVTLPVLSGRESSEKFLRDAIGRVRMRRLEARHLRPLSAPTAHEGQTQPPVVIDFRRLAHTAPLRIDGAATNYDGSDAGRGLPLTHFDVTRGDWEYVYEGAPLRLPDGWRLAAGAAQLPAGVGLVKDSSGRPWGVPASAVGFDARGRAWADRDGDGLAESSPETLAEGAVGGGLQFWAVYFTDGETAVAVAVHSTGVEEAWRWSPGDGWHGWRNRAAGE